MKISGDGPWNEIQSNYYRQAIDSDNIIGIDI